MLLQPQNYWDSYQYTVVIDGLLRISLMLWLHRVINDASRLLVSIMRQAAFFCVMAPCILIAPSEDLGIQAANKGRLGYTCNAFATVFSVFSGKPVAVGMQIARHLPTDATKLW